MRGCGRGKDRKQENQKQDWMKDERYLIVSFYRKLRERERQLFSGVTDIFHSHTRCTKKHKRENVWDRGKEREKVRTPINWVSWNKWDQRTTLKYGSRPWTWCTPYSITLKSCDQTRSLSKWRDGRKRLRTRAHLIVPVAGAICLCLAGKSSAVT